MLGLDAQCRYVDLAAVGDGQSQEGDRGLIG